MAARPWWDRAASWFAGGGDDNEFEEFDIVSYRQSVPGFEKHHGVVDVWARNNIAGDNRRNAPTIVLSPDRHQLTKDWFNNWRIDRTGSLTGYIDWQEIDVRERNRLTEDMMRYAGVPDDQIREYIRAFNQYIYSLQDIQ